MFERFTDRSRAVMVMAQQEARLLNHPVIGTEHLLLALMQERGGIVADALEPLGLSLDAVRAGARNTIAAPGGRAGSPPFTPRAKKVLELSLREAQALGHGYISTEHILLGLIQEGEGVAIQILLSLGVDLSPVRERVIELTAEHQDQGPEEEIPGAVPSCPMCLGVLEEEARVRQITVSPEPSDSLANSISIEVVYCRRCGTALGTFKSESPDNHLPS
jgi:ATP-dependent Clp protease ATP-binding subunit ClpA